MKKLVSVIIPSCNDGKYLEKAINSILAQTYPNIEIIVIDSSDDRDTLAILEGYKEKIHCYTQPKRGVAAALNYALEHAKGEYIARMDADDISLPQRIFKQVSFLEENPEIDVVGAQCDVINEAGETVGEIDPGYYSDSEIKAKIIFENCIIHPTVMMRSKLIREGWRYDEKHYAEDIRLWMKMAVKGVKFANMQEHFLLYRHCENNMSSNSEKVALSVNRSAREYVEELFGIPKNKYEDEDFARPYYSVLIRKGKADFIKTQLCLLQDIFEKNEEKRAIEYSTLNRELNLRWKWIFENYGSDITSFFQKDIFDPYVTDDKFFLNEIAAHTMEMSVKGVIELMNEMLKINEKIIKKQKSELKDIVVYGVGKRGKELLKILEHKISSGELNWKLTAVADVQKIEIQFMGKQYETINQEELVKLNPPVVIVSSNKYYDEIYRELKDKGLKSNIMNGNYIC